MHVASVISVVLNGKDVQVSGEATISSILENMGWKPELVAVQLNGEVPERAVYTSLKIRSGDHMNVVHFVGGG